MHLKVQFHLLNFEKIKSHNFKYKNKRLNLPKINTSSSNIIQKNFNNFLTENSSDRYQFQNYKMTYE